MKTWRRTAICGMLLLACCARANACLNDTQVRQAEAEFRSRYEHTAVAQPTWRTIVGINTLGVVGLAVGVGAIALLSMTVARRKR